MGETGAVDHLPGSHRCGTVSHPELDLELFVVMRPEDIAAIGAGLLAFALGAATVVGVLQPEGSMAGNGVATTVGGLIAGAVGLYIGSARGWGRRVAIVGMVGALVGALLFGGSVAFDLLLEA